MPPAGSLLPALALTLWCAVASAADVTTGRIASGPPGTVAVGTASVTYFARAGDTLTSIAGQYTDKPGNWIALGRLNHIERDSAIPIGTGILIPGELLAETPAKATVVALTGTVSATGPDGTTARLGLGATVVEGTRIDTGGNSFLTLALADQSRISVPSNTRVQVAKLRTARYLNSPRTEVLLLRGRVESRIAPLEANRGRYEVRTPLSVAGVRGTHFRVGLIAEGASSKVATETLDGKVAIALASRAGGPDALVLARGKGNITEPHALGPAIELLPAPRLGTAGAVQAVFPRTRIPVQAVAGARTYHLQLARDPEAIDLLAESSANTPTLAIDGVPDGAYYARLSAIDRFGLEGNAGIESITLRGGTATSDAGGAAQDAPLAPFVAASDEGTVTLRWTPTVRQSMRLQVARDAGFTYLIASRLSTTGEARMPRPPFGTYYARVERIDTNGNTRASSPVQAFIVTDQWVMNDGNPVSVTQSAANPAR